MPRDEMPGIERDLHAPFILPLRLAFETPQTTGSEVQTSMPPRDVRIACDEVLRLLPGRRLVARGTFDAQVCVVKLFVGADARRYFDRELKGVRALANTRVPAPLLLATGTGSSGERALVYTYLAGAQALTDHSADQATELVSVFAQLHAAGCVHSDPHLDNFARSGSVVYALDADGIHTNGKPLSASTRARNLGRLLAQFPPRFDGHVAGWRATYLLEDPSATADLTVQRLDRALKSERAQRVRRYMKKTLRECSEFTVRKTAGRRVIARREDLTDALQAFAGDPEGVLSGADVLKPGNSATVFRVVLGNKTYVVKRYNLKSPVHRLRRSLKSRVRVAWRNGHLLWFIGVRTARPLMLIENRAGFLVVDSYIVMQDHGTLNLIDAVRTEGLRDCWLAAFEDLVISLRNARVRHGDFKGTNFLVCGDALSLIDLDALGEGDIGRDLPRFLKNWEHLPLVQARFERSLNDLGFR
ncbi:MAG: phosphotransferase [Proteobacteria bacterium]|nr:phosphotransferase [Pseudomonadota bacterium]